MAAEGAEAPLSLAEAVQTIDQATHFAEPLRRRAEGVTIALWGFVGACVVLTSGVLDNAYGFWDAGGWRRAVSALMFLPWAAIGVFATIAIWRMAELSARREIAGRRRSPTTIIAWLAALLAMLFVVSVVVPVGAAGVSIAFVGLAWTAVGALDLYKATPTGRRTILVVGIAIVVAGAAYGWATRSSPDAGWDWLPVAGLLTFGLIPILGGLAQALRG